MSFRGTWRGHHSFIINNDILLILVLLNTCHISSRYYYMHNLFPLNTNNNEEK